MLPLQMPHSSNMRFRHFSQLPMNLASSGRNSRASREEREERARNALRIVRVGNRRVRHYVIDSTPRPPTPPPCYAHHDPICIKQEIGRRPDVIAEGHVAADLDPGLERDGPISTGGIWSQYVERVAEESFTCIRLGCTAMGTRDLHPGKFHASANQPSTRQYWTALASGPISPGTPNKVPKWLEVSRVFQYVPVLPVWGIYPASMPYSL